MKKIFQTNMFSGLELKNRIVRSATWENMATDTGHITSELIEVYEKLAQNEVGLIITGYANIVPEEKPNPGMMGIYDDSFIEEYKVLTERVHQYNSKVILQVAYGGTKTTYNVGERVIFAPSEVAERGTNTLGKMMSKKDIDYIVSAFGESARRAQLAGFDGIEIHGAHTYLINQFLSPYYNQRTDEYGGSLENRMRFLKEIYYAMRKQVGEAFSILLKLTATEFFEGGLTFEETKVICKEMEYIGIDAIEISGNIHGKANAIIGESFDGHTIEKEGYFVQYANVISQELEIPVITVGGFKNLEYLEKLARDTSIEYFALSRPLLAEPDLIKSWKEGKRLDSKCIRCSKCRTPEGNYCVIFK